MKFLPWLKNSSIKQPQLRQFLESHPKWFVRCDADGTENPQGQYWAVQREHLHDDEEEEAIPCRESA
jgi:hypothetical protein